MAPLPMVRKRFTKRRALLIVAVLLAVGGTVWRLPQGPREPVYKGKSLSWWFTDGIDQQGPNFQGLTAEELRGLGPEAVKWLSYKAGQTNIWDRGTPSSSYNVSRFVWWLRIQWFDRAAFRFERIRFESIIALGELGPDAVPAVPKLLDAVRHADNDARLVATETLLKMGSASWPAVTDAIRRGDTRTREILTSGLDVRDLPKTPTADNPERFAEIVDLILPLATDRGARKFGRQKLEACLEGWQVHPQLAEGVRLVAESLPRRNEEERREIARFLSHLDSQGSVAVPALTALAETPDEFTRVQILCALAILEPGNSRWPDALYKLAASPNKALAETAEQALIHAGK